MYSLDPAGELRPWESPYSYTGNNPISRLEIDGKYWIEPILMNTGNRYFPNKTIMYNVNFDSRAEITTKYIASLFIPGVKSSMLENRGFNLTSQEYFVDIVPGMFSLLFKAPTAINRSLGALSAYSNRDLFSLIDDPELITTFENMDFSRIQGAVKIGNTWYFTNKSSARKAVNEAKKYLNHNREGNSNVKTTENTEDEENEDQNRILRRESSEDRWERYDPARR